MRDDLFVELVQLLPCSAISRLVGALANAPLPPRVHQAIIRAFVRHYDVDVSEAEKPVEEYRTLAEFFIRRLRPDARPVDRRSAVVVSPVDATLGDVGTVTRERLTQVKGRTYTIGELLGEPNGESGLARGFDGGSFTTLYLSPRDYHRIHSPVDGRVTRYRHIPGTLFPVNPPATRGIEKLFCRNERLITEIESEVGRVLVIKVGATSVGRITARYADVVTHRPGRLRPVSRRLPEPWPVRRGEEIAAFNLGSTVVLLFQPGRVSVSALRPGDSVRVGSTLLRVRTRQPAVAPVE